MNKVNSDHETKEKNIAPAVGSYFGSEISIRQEIDALADVRSARERYIVKDMCQKEKMVSILMVKDAL